MRMETRRLTNVGTSLSKRRGGRMIRTDGARQPAETTIAIPPEQVEQDDLDQAGLPGLLQEALEHRHDVRGRLVAPLAQDGHGHRLLPQAPGLTLGAGTLAVPGVAIVEQAAGEELLRRRTELDTDEGQIAGDPAALVGGEQPSPALGRRLAIVELPQ